MAQQGVFFKTLIFTLGVGILALLVLAYFIPLTVEQGTNYITKSSLLGVLIFYNPFILALYVLIAIILIIKGSKKY